MMLVRRRSDLRPHNRAIVECAHCSGWRRCWDEKPPAGSGFLVQTELRLERGALLALPPAPRAVFVLVSGCLTLHARASDGSRRAAGFRLPGELVGLESWARAENPYEIRAASASVLCRPTLAPFGQGRGNGALLERLLAKSAAQLDQAMRPWPGLPARERVAAFIEDFVQRAQRAQVTGSSLGSVRLPITRADIGSYLGLAEETVVRSLAMLRRTRHLEVQGKLIILRRPRTAARATP